MSQRTNCDVCGFDIRGDWNNCPNCGSPLHSVPPRRVLRVYRETPDKIEQHLTLQQLNHNHFHLDFGELLRPAPAAKVPIPGWLWVASILGVFAVPLVRSWWTVGITSQILLYAVYRAGTDRQKLWGLLLLVFAWAVCLFAWPPTRI